MSNRIQQHLTWLGIACCALAVVGCDHGPQRVVVAGAVSYRGESIKHGSISFFPSAGTAGTAVIVPISNGRFSVESQGGLPLGAYDVAILGVHKPAGTAVGAGGRTASGERPPPEDEQQYVPAKYNEKSELKATIEAKPNPFTLDFVLTE